MTNDLLTLPQDPMRKAYLDAGLWGSSVCLDNLFVRNVRSSPDKIILCDSAGKQVLTGITALNLRAAEAETVVTSLCARFLELGLEGGQVIGLQLPNTVELPLILLACLRLGIIPALLPLLWAERDIQAALDLLKPVALVSVTKTGTLNPADTLRYAAASLFSVRHVMAFGNDLPDGVIGLQDIFNAPAQTKKDSTNFSGKADQPAFITFRVTAHGPVPVLRSHNHAMSAALMPLLESGMEPAEEVILSSLQAANLGGLATGFLPWLLSGGRLVMHQVDGPQSLTQQVVDEEVTRLAVPGIALSEVLSQLINKQHSLKSIFSIYANASAKLPEVHGKLPCLLIDGYAFDEMAFITRARAGTTPRPLRLGAQVAPSTGIGPALAELGLSSTSRLIVRGASVPYNADHKEGFQLTGYVAKLENENLQITGRIDQLAYVGGMPVSLNEVASLILQIEGVEAVQVNAVADDVFGEILEARVYFSRTQEPQALRLARLQKDFENAKLAPYKIPARFVIDPSILTQPATVHQTAKKQAG